MKKSLLAVLFLAFSMLASQAGAFVFYESPTIGEVLYISPVNGYESAISVDKSIMNALGLKQGQVIDYGQLMAIVEMEKKEQKDRGRQNQ